MHRNWKYYRHDTYTHPSYAGQEIAAEIEIDTEFIGTLVMRAAKNKGRSATAGGMRVKVKLCPVENKDGTSGSGS